jgi:hypothetical protein
MATMNSFDRIDTTPTTVVRPPATERASESQQSECCCPELCLLDHDN